MLAAKVDKCANPECHAQFKRMGTGKLYTRHVSSPHAWGLPLHSKQKVVWLCSKCSAKFDVRFDEAHHRVLLVQHERSRHQVA